MNKLVHILRRHKRRIIGLMSGTSLDGLDIADVTFLHQGMATKIEKVNYQCVKYPTKIKNLLLKIDNFNTEDICRLNYQLGIFFGEAVLSYWKENNLSYKDFDLIGSHGQTIYHIDGHSTLQIGEADLLSKLTHLPVIFDFRSADIAAGKKGAPLVQYFEQLLVKNFKKNTVFLNIGGIANLSYFPTNSKEIIFFDTGPGMMVIDSLVRFHTQGKYSYDCNGNFARQGTINEKFLSVLLEHSFFGKKPPKSTGREEFGEKYTQQLINLWENDYSISFEDFLRTATALTAHSIFKNFQLYCPQAELVIVSGGGTHNNVLQEELQKLFHFLEYKKFHELFHFHEDAKEAVAFAFFAHEKLNSHSDWYPLPNPGLGKIAYINS